VPYRRSGRLTSIAPSLAYDGAGEPPSVAARTSGSITAARREAARCRYRLSHRPAAR
jgi:hypothetical protein